MSKASKGDLSQAEGVFDINAVFAGIVRFPWVEPWIIRLRAR